MLLYIEVGHPQSVVQNDIAYRLETQKFQRKKWKEIKNEKKEEALLQKSTRLGFGAAAREGCENGVRALQQLLIEEFHQIKRGCELKFQHTISCICLCPVVQLSIRIFVVIELLNQQ